MPATLIEELTGQRAAVLDEIETLLADDDIDPAGEEFTARQRRAELLERRIEAAQQAEKQRQDLGVFHTQLASAAPPAEQRSWGEIVTASDGMDRFIRNRGGKTHLAAAPFNLRALLDSGTLPAELYSPATRILAAAPRQQTPLLDAVRKQVVTGGKLIVGYYPAAAPLAGVTAEGALKPEASVTITATEVELVTVAHWVEATRKLLSDAPQMRDFIETSLLRGVLDKFEGLVATAITGGSYTGVEGADMVESIRLGIAAVEAAGYTPSAVLINPADAAKLDLLIWNTGNLGVPGMGSSLFGMRLIPVNALPAGTAYVGNFTDGVVLGYSDLQQLYVTDSDTGIDGVSNFKRNIITLLAEGEGAAAVARPEAIAECTPTVAAGGTSGGSHRSSK